MINTISVAGDARLVLLSPDVTNSLDLANTLGLDKRAQALGFVLCHGIQI